MKLIDWEKPLVSKGYPAKFVQKLFSVDGDRYLVTVNNGLNEYALVVNECGYSPQGSVYNKPEYVWVNIYRDYAVIHPTKESADAGAGTYRTARIKVEIGRFDV